MQKRWVEGNTLLREYEATSIRETLLDALRETLRGYGLSQEMIEDLPILEANHPGHSYDDYGWYCYNVFDKGAGFYIDPIAEEMYSGTKVCVYVYMDKIFTKKWLPSTVDSFQAWLRAGKEEGSRIEFKGCNRNSLRAFKTLCKLGNFIQKVALKYPKAHKIVNLRVVHMGYESGDTLIPRYKWETWSNKFTIDGRQERFNNSLRYVSKQDIEYVYSTLEKTSF